MRSRIVGPQSLKSQILALGEVKKTNMFSVRPLWKKGRRRRLSFFFFPFQNGRRTHFPKQPAGLFFQDGCHFFVLMGPTWTRDMTSVYLGLDLEKDRIFLCFFNS